MRNWSELVEILVGMAAEVRRQLGPGLPEPAYAAALGVEVEAAGLKARRGLALPVLYKGRPVGEFPLDLMVEGAVAVGIKGARRRGSSFPAPVLTTLRIAGGKAGLLLDFNARLPGEGVTRFVL